MDHRHTAGMLQSNGCMHLFLFGQRHAGTTTMCDSRKLLISAVAVNLCRLHAPNHQQAQILVHVTVGPLKPPKAAVEPRSSHCELFLVPKVTGLNNWYICRVSCTSDSITESCSISISSTHCDGGRCLWFGRRVRSEFVNDDVFQSPTTWCWE